MDQLKGIKAAEAEARSLVTNLKEEIRILKETLNKEKDEKTNLISEKTAIEEKASGFNTENVKLKEQCNALNEKIKTTQEESEGKIILHFLLKSNISIYY